MEEDYITVEALNQNLKPYDAKIIREGDTGYLKYKREQDKTPITITTAGKIGEDELYHKIAKIISKKRKEKQTEIFKELTRLPKIRRLESERFIGQMVVSTIIALFLVFVFLVLSKVNLSTGYVINNIPNTTANIGIIICIMGIIGLLFYKWKSK